METSTHPTSHSALAGAMIGAADGTVPLMASAVTFKGDGLANLSDLPLLAPGDDDVVVDILWSGISTGTERLFWSGDMPPFPGMGYPLVPGYEAVGEIIWSPSNPDRVGEKVFVPGARCFDGAHGLFGSAASRLVVPAVKAFPIGNIPAQSATLLALAATAYHAIKDHVGPDLIIGHGVLGRLIARVSMALGHQAPNVWEINPERADGDGYAVIEPECDGRTDYKAIYDVSGDPEIVDTLISHSAHGAEIVLAGFYPQRLSFAFPAAFMKEIRLRIAAEWQPSDLKETIALAESGSLNLDGLITHTRRASQANAAYATAFDDPGCLKMIIDWRDYHDTL